MSRQKVTEAEQFCDIANRVLESIRACGRELDPRTACDAAWWGNPFWYIQMPNQRAWQRKKHSLCQLVGSMRLMLLLASVKSRGQNTRSAKFSDGSIAWAVRIPVILREGEWWWGC